MSSRNSFILCCENLVECDFSPCSIMLLPAKSHLILILHPSPDENCSRAQWSPSQIHLDFLFHFSCDVDSLAPLSTSSSVRPLFSSKLSFSVPNNAKIFFHFFRSRERTHLSSEGACPYFSLSPQSSCPYSSKSSWGKRFFVEEGASW